MIYQKFVRTIWDMSTLPVNESNDRGPGRPPVREKSQNARLYVRTIEEEKELLESAAEAAGMTLSEWIRNRLVRTAKRELRRYE